VRVVTGEEKVFNRVAVERGDHIRDKGRCLARLGRLDRLGRCRRLIRLLPFPFLLLVIVGVLVRIARFGAVNHPVSWGTASSTRVRLAGLLAGPHESSIECSERGGGVERERGLAGCKGLFVRTVELPSIHPEDRDLDVLNQRVLLGRPDRVHERAEAIGQTIEQDIDAERI
jgi:hypothetical protein